MSGLKYARHFGRGKQYHSGIHCKKKLPMFVLFCKEKYPHFSLLFASEKQEENLGKLRERLKELCCLQSPLSPLLNAWFEMLM